MPPQSKTATSTPRLSELARHFSFPDGIVKTVWPRVVAQGAEIGLGFDWWQSQLGTVCLGYGADGKYVATVGGVGLSIPRQVGKTYFVLAMLVCLCILFPGLQVVWTAHHLRTSTKTFTTLRGICRRRKVSPHVKSMRAANGEQQVEFRNGSMIMFGARSMGFGRGFDEIDVEVFDEAQILDTKALEDMIAATNQARHEHGALLFFMGTPPRPSDPSDAFTARRAEARAGEAEDAIWLEIGADPKSDPDDRMQWPTMNPSFPSRTPLESMLRLRKNLKDEDSWNREGRGIWDDDGATSVIPWLVWDDLRDATSRIDSRHEFALDVSPTQSSAAIAVAGLRFDGLSYLELTASGGEVDHRQGVDWVVPRLREMADRHLNFRVSILAGSAAESLVPALKKAGVPVNVVKASEAPAACGLLYTMAMASPSRLRHFGQPELWAALLGAEQMNVGDGAWKWTRRKSSTDITPLYAATLALWVANQKRPTPNVW